MAGVCQLRPCRRPKHKGGGSVSEREVNQVAVTQGSTSGGDGESTVAAAETTGELDCKRSRGRNRCWRIRGHSPDDLRPLDVIARTMGALLNFTLVGLLAFLAGHYVWSGLSASDQTQIGVFVSRLCGDAHRLPEDIRETPEGLARRNTSAVSLSMTVKAYITGRLQCPTALDAISGQGRMIGCLMVPSLLRSLS
jgi:hypothetical protein